MRRFTVMSAAVWVGLALLLGATVTYLVERKMLEQTTIASLDYFRGLAPFMITGSDFVGLRQGDAYEAFDRRIREQFFTPKVVVVKIYDAAGTLVYHSQDRALVGRIFRGNAPLEKALRGEAVFEVSDLRGEEHVYERQAGFARLLELYFPIMERESGRVLGAYEIYSPLEPLAQGLARFRLLVWGVIGAGLALFYGALSWVFRRASRTILGQKEALERTAEDLRRAYEELQAAQARLVRSEQLASAGRLAAGLVHEIGNPLASLLGMVDLLGRCRGRPEEMAACRENLDRMAAEITRLKGILQGLLDYARPAEVRREPVEVNRMVERTMVLVASQPTFHRICCERALDPGAPVVVTDERRLQQVLVNVLLNAADAMPDGGTLDIATGHGPAPPQGADEARAGRLLPPGAPVVWLAVRDTGRGIAPTEMGRIFEPFFTTKERGRGAGLGLAICQALIEELGGEVRVSSRPGAGTRVHILLPPDGSEARGDGS
ncbi:MAG: hypothetical protein HYY54_08630 [candidate division NC10 bacterium]|nr:hypothetical protein [candidate division NC10 bacterium]